MHPNHPLRRSTIARQSQAGAATVIVVMVLFFVAALAAAYASRNIVIEQRTAVNHYRATQSFEAAEAGVEWALALLNSGRIDASCKPTTDGAFGNARQRYLMLAPTHGHIWARLKAGAPFLSTSAAVWMACSSTGNSIHCSCPDPSTPALLTLPTGGAAFGVRFHSEFHPNHANLIRIEANGCEGPDEACLTAFTTTAYGRCNATVCSLAAQASSIKHLPIAAITARGSVIGSDFGVYNTHQGTGLTILSGGDATGSFQLGTIAGSPPEGSIRSNDPVFGLFESESDDCLLCTFAATFGVSRETYTSQPAIHRIRCDSPCEPSDVTAAINSTGRGSLLWLSGAGGLRISAVEDIGSSASPVLMVIDGPLQIEASATASSTSRARIFGLVYAAGALLNGGRIDGALVTPGSVSGGAAAQVVYDPSILRHLRSFEGSWVRVPGGWRDYL